MRGSRVAVVGVGETAYVRATERPLMDLVAEAARNAVADAGLKLSDIDGFVGNRNTVSLDDLCFALGIDSRPFCAVTDVYGGTATSGQAIQLAQLAIEAGLAKYVLVPYGIKCSKPGGPYAFHAREPLDRKSTRLNSSH